MQIYTFDTCMHVMHNYNYACVILQLTAWLIISSSSIYYAVNECISLFMSSCIASQRKRFPFSRVVSYDLPIGAFCNNNEIFYTARVRIRESVSRYICRAAGRSITLPLGPVGTNVFNMEAEMVGTACTKIGELDGHAYIHQIWEYIIICTS